MRRGDSGADNDSGLPMCASVTVCVCSAVVVLSVGLSMQMEQS